MMEPDPLSNRAFKKLNINLLPGNDVQLTHTGESVNAVTRPGGSLLKDFRTGEDKKQVAFRNVENQPPRESQPSIKPRGRKNSLTGWSTDLAKLRSEFDSLQQQLQKLPAQTHRRESGAGLGQGHDGMRASWHALPSTQTQTGRANLPEPVSSQPPAPAAVLQPTSTLAATAVAPPQPAAVLVAASSAASFSVPATDLALRAATAAAAAADCPLESKENRGESLFQFPNNISAGSRAWKAATEVFQDAELTVLCEEGLHKQLQRTKDGATETSRIQELAGLVKLLRKCVRELGSRASMYVDSAVKLEKDLVKQVETNQLSSDTAIKALEAELAGVKKSLAGFEASFKTDKANWGAELEGARYEAIRLKRELERVTEERDKAREDSKRADVARQQMEMELKDLKKAASQQMREVTVSQSEAVRIISEEKVAVEKREAGLRDEVSKLSQRLDAANMCIEALQGELALLQQVHGQVKDGLRSKAASEESLVSQVAQLQRDLNQERATLAQTLSQLETANIKANSLHTDLTTALEESERVKGELDVVKSDCNATKDMLAELSRSYDNDKVAWAGEQAQLKGAIAASCAREAALCEEKAAREAALTEEKSALKSALATLMAQKDEAEMASARTAREMTALNNEIVNLKHEVEFVTGQQTAAEEKAAALQETIAGYESKLAAADEQLAAKQARLSVLEDKFEALQEVLGDAGGQRDVVSGLLTRISTLQAAVATAEATRRKLHNELVSIRGNIRVYCRVKPHASPVVKCSTDQSSISIAVDGKEHGFSFDRVYPPGTAQTDVFDGVSELVQSALDGYHVCLFSYGQTGAGKTYTMQGTDAPGGRGIIPRAVEKILETAQRLSEQCEWEYSMEASFVEVYNNALRDLLGGRDAPYINEQSAIKHDPTGGHTIVSGISKVAVADASCADALIRRAGAARACEATAMNAESSRSHVVFMLYISGHHPPTGTRLQGCLCLVDLAGSERLDRSQAEDARKKEACAINQSLSALGDIFAALSTKSGHIPYRNSKLTYLLQPCLGGQGKTLMFVNINPEPASSFESLCSLKFAAKVNGCETGAKGGAKRNTAGGGTSTLVPSQMAAAAGGAGDGPKRLSLPGPPKAAAGSDPSAKRMSMYSGNGGSTGAFGAGSKRPPPGGPPGIPTSGNAAKRSRH